MTAIPTIETITPQDAKDYLAVNTNNRVIRRLRVVGYAQAMTDGEWVLTGEPITFSADGQLVNGQHRLLACIEAGVPFTSVVIRGVTSNAFDYIDSGLVRSVGDIVAHAGIKNSKAVSAAARLVIAYRHGVLHNTNQMYLAATRTAIKDEIASNDVIYQEAVRQGNLARTRGHTPSAYAAFYVIASGETGQEFVDGFSIPLVTGTDLGEGDPRLTLTNQVLGPRRPRYNIDSLALLIRAWNAWVNNEPRRQIKGWTRGTPFPILET